MSNRISLFESLSWVLAGVLTALLITFCEARGEGDSATTDAPTEERAAPLHTAEDSGDC